MKKILSISILSFYLILNLSNIVVATSSLEENKSTFIQISNTIKNLDNKIAVLDDEIFSLHNKISSNQNKISELKLKIDQTNIKIYNIQQELTENEEMLSYRLREIYKTGNFSGINLAIYLFKANNLEELFSRIHATKIIIEFDNEIIDENNKLVNSLNSSLSALQTKKEELDKLNNDTKESLAEIETKKKDLNISKSNLLKEKEQISSVIKENEENLVKHSLDIINSSSSNIDQLNDAIMTLKSLLPQISTDSVIDKINSAIYTAKEKINDLKKSEINTPQINNPPNDGSYKATYSMEATAYSGHTITATGTIPVRDPNGISTVAVDPDVIPLGSKLYIPGYGYAIAADTGGVIKGNKIDLFMNSHEECITFGRRNITVHLVAYPNEW